MEKNQKVIKENIETEQLKNGKFALTKRFYHDRRIKVYMFAFVYVYP